MKERILTAAVAGAVALAAILWSSPIGIGLLCAAALAWGIREAAVLTRTPVYEVGVLAAIGVAGLLARPSATPFAPVALGMSILGGIGLLFVARGSSRFGLLSGLWLAAPIVSAVWLHQSTAAAGFGPNLLLLAMIPLWVGDSLAYFVGRAIGRHPLAPSISPKKTWEGAIANLLGCAAAAWGLGTWIGVPTPAWLAVGLTTGFLGQAGDLLESAVKRQQDIKDSGELLPGHGGLLDRLDSLLLSLPASVMALSALAPEMFHVKPF